MPVPVRSASPLPSRASKFRHFSFQGRCISIKRKKLNGYDINKIIMIAMTLVFTYIFMKALLYMSGIKEK